VDGTLFASQCFNRIDSRCPARRQRRRQQRQRKSAIAASASNGDEWAYLEQKAAAKARSRCCSSQTDQTPVTVSFDPEISTSRTMSSPASSRAMPDRNLLRGAWPFYFIFIFFLYSFFFKL